MKKNYTVSLDFDAIEPLKVYLEKRGMSLSGFLNQSAIEYMETINNLELPADVDKMPVGEFLAMFGRMMKGMKK